MDGLYRELMERIPDDIIADGIAVGEYWIVVKASCGCGAASVYDEAHETGRYEKHEGRSLRDLAELIDSPVPVEQGIAMAAINTYYNQFERLAELEDAGILTVDRTTNSFVEYGIQATGKNVAFVGHFCGLESFMKDAAEVAVLEKRPQPGDYPAEMCDEIIPGRDFVFMTGATLANNTAAHLLELCRSTSNTRGIFVGPTTTLSEILMEHGAVELAGTVITDPDAAFEAALDQDHMSIFATGQKVRTIKTDKS